MKRVFRLIVILFLSQAIFSVSYGASYYFSTSTGNDSRTAAEAQNPNTPWRTITKLNQIFPSLRPGDQVLFNRGEEFYGTINMSSSGTEISPIKIGAYGNGLPPQITSFVKVTGWQSSGAGRFRSTNTINTKEVKVVVVDGKIEEMGRFPNTETNAGGFFSIGTVQNNNSISSTEITSSPNFLNGEIVIRKVLWVTDRHKITSHIGSTLTFGTPLYNLNNTNSTTYNPTRGFGFFIQNHIETLDVFGEWFFNENESRVYVHFGNSNPNNHTVEVSTLNNLLTKTNSASNITIENLAFRGSNKNAISIQNGRNIKLINTIIENIGENAIEASGVDDLEISRNTIRNILNNGITLRNGSDYSRILENNIENIGTFAGGMRSGDGNGIGIFINDDNSLVENNKVINTGYNGIAFRYNNVKINGNYIYGYCLHKTDGGGIYSFGGASGTEVFSNRVISNNIILKGKGNNFGTPYFNSLEHINRPPQAIGIFMDDNVNNVLIEGNTIAQSPFAGLSISNSSSITVKNNTFFDNERHIMLGNSSRGGDVRQLNVHENVMISKDPTQSFYHLRSFKDDIKEFGMLNNNYFANPLGDNYKISVGYVSTTGQINKDLNSDKWTAYSGKDSESSTLTFKTPAFKVNGAIGNNLYPTGTFESNLVGVNCSNCSTSRVSGEINGGTLQVITTSGENDKSVRFLLGAVAKDKNYILKFKAKANRTGVVKAFLRFVGTPWQPISQSTFIEVGTEAKEFTLLFTSKISLTSSTLVMENRESSWTMWIDDLEIYEADVELANSEELFLFEYNDSKSTKIIPLNGEYINGKNRIFTKSIELAPYSSALLIRTSEEGPTSEVIIPQIKISLSNTNISLLEGGNAKFDTEILSTVQIKKIDYYANDQLIGTSNSAPFSFTWVNLPLGKQIIKANATDILGENGWSQELPIEVAKLENSPSINPNDQSEFQLYINAGSNESVNFEGSVFQGETLENRFFSASNSSTAPSTTIHPLYQSERFTRNLSYAVPVPNGNYTVKTMHTESWFGTNGREAGPGKRVFNILIEGQTVKENFDIFLHNNNNPTVLAFTDIIVDDGILNLDLLATANNATISGFAITKTNLQGGTEYHLNIGSQANTSYNGITFEGEGTNNQTIINGTITRNESASTDELFKKERWGKTINLKLPLPNGEYRIITYHNELWFGSESLTGSRVFDIYLEGIRVKENFDLKKENNNKQMSLAFNNIIVADNQLDLDLIAKVNNATISGISIIGVNSPTNNFGLFLNVGDTDDDFYNGVKFIDENNACKCFNTNSRTFINQNASTEPIFQKERFHENLTYNISLPNGTYTVYTFHNELWFGKEGPTARIGRRVFDIEIENEIVKSNFDIFSENNNNPTILKFDNIEVTDGILNLEFNRKVNNATVSAIAIINNTSNPFARTTTSINTSYDYLFSVNESNTSISTVDRNTRIYPNPVTDIVSIELNNTSAINLISLIDVNGRLITTVGSNELLGGKILKMNLSGQRPGVYFLKIISANPIYSYTHRIIKVN